MSREPRLLAFVCNWACYTPRERAEAEQALSGQDDRLIWVPCSGRLSPLLLLNAIQEGYDAVVLVGCRPGSCHYREGSGLARRRLETLHEFLVYLGLEPERLQIFWKSPLSDRPFAELVAEVRAAVGRAGPASRLVRTLAP